MIKGSNMPIRFKRVHKDAKIPTRATDGSAGFDLYSTKTFVLKPGVRHMFPIGIQCAIPPGWAGHIFPRSGWAVNHGLDKLAGLIDPDYRGEIHAVLINSGDEDIEIKTGDRIAQMTVVPFLADAIEVDDFDEPDNSTVTERTGGFGSTWR